MPAGWHINTLEKPGDTSASQPGQTTKDDGLPYGGGGFSFVSVPAGWHVNTLEKPGCCAAWQTTKNDGLPHGGGGFSFVSVPAGWHINTIEKTAEAQADRLKSVTQEEQAEACATAARRFFIAVRGPRAHAGRPRKTMVCPGLPYGGRRFFMRIRASGLAYQHSPRHTRLDFILGDLHNHLVPTGGVVTWGSG